MVSTTHTMLKDFDGTPLDIVHRDVSPQNVFVTYDGVVKLLDFGIAKAATHVVETRTGMVKGKFAYMAPEQARGGSSTIAPISGAWVSCSGRLSDRRLFKGPNEMMTINAALAGEIADLGELSPEIPESLVAVTRKALSRDVDERYQNALEMKEELEKYMREAADGPISRNDLGGYVKSLFEDMIEQQSKVVRLFLSESSQLSPTASHSLRSFESTPPDIRSTPHSGSSFHSTPPSFDSISPMQAMTPIPANTDTPSLNQGDGSGWYGKIAILIVSVVLAMLSTGIVLWLYGPGHAPPDQYLLNDRPSEPTKQQSHLAVHGGDTGVRAADASPPPSETSVNRNDAGVTRSESRAMPDREASTRTKASSTKERRSRRFPRKSSKSQPQVAARPIQSTSTSNNSQEQPATPIVSEDEEPPRRPSQPEEMGFLTIDTVPWSTVYIEGKNLGNTPVVST